MAVDLEEVKSLKLQLQDAIRRIENERKTYQTYPATCIPSQVFPTSSDFPPAQELPAFSNSSNFPTPTSDYSFPPTSELPIFSNTDFPTPASELSTFSFPTTSELPALNFPASTQNFPAPALNFPAPPTQNFPAPPTQELSGTPQPLPIQTKLKNEPLRNWEAPEKNMEEVMAECRHFIKMEQPGTAAQMLARHAVFGEETMRKCTPLGSRELKALPQSGLWAIKCAIFKLYPECWSKPESFEPAWKKCRIGIEQACGRLRRKSKIQ